MNEGSGENALGPPRAACPGGHGTVGARAHMSLQTHHKACDSGAVKQQYGFCTETKQQISLPKPLQAMQPDQAADWLHSFSPFPGRQWGASRSPPAREPRPDTSGCSLCSPVLTVLGAVLSPLSIHALVLLIQHED